MCDSSVLGSVPGAGIEWWAQLRGHAPPLDLLRGTGTNHVPNPRSGYTRCCEEKKAGQGAQSATGGGQGKPLQGSVI